jgi:2-C-methyl-D-erythritol 4-phosphate cytidylyltransferase
MPHPTNDLTFASFDFKPRCFALVPCAGVGERAGVGGPKQYHQVAGRAVVAHTLIALAQVARIEATLVVLSPSDTQFEQHMPGFGRQSEASGRGGDAGAGRGWTARVGGASRAESVANGLNELIAAGAQAHDWVLVHDAARCLVEPEWIERLVDECEHDEVGGLLALPLADTLKASASGPQGEARAQATVDRAGKWAAQTPQMFRLGLLRPALLSALSDPDTAAAITDEASAIEMLGHRPRLVRGAWDNIKLTWPEDFALAERLLRSR